MNFGLIDCANRTEIRGETGKTGTFYIATGQGGLWKLIYTPDKDTVTLRKLSAEGDAIYRMGLGLGAPDADYYKDNKAIYCNGIIDGEYDFIVVWMMVRAMSGSILTDRCMVRSTV